tara:strand:+ start:842 stop:1417 length:576 start_codon:yes stop_codon:yes gene_type:complete
METVQLIFKIFWMVWIPWMILYFGSLALAHYGYPKLLHFILDCLYYFSKEDRDARKQAKQEKIRMHGTHEEKIELHNNLNPDYQLMTNDEVFDKYEGVSRDKVTIVPTPNFLLDTRTNSFYGNSKERQDDLDFIREKLNEGKYVTPPQPKPYVITKSVLTYSGVIDMAKINKSEKIFIFPQKGEHYRFITI